MSTVGVLKADPRVTENARVHRRQQKEWPVMPVARARLRLEPDDFFDGGHGCG
ncbi:hypothetical protein ACIQGO_13175 [Streptomyces shenzhenensis]|uniref:hypothetical protein n=1 Tax=Streptomyces shenzhenensis TaxID=943815 RepID=UPI00382F9D4E